MLRLLSISSTDSNWRMRWRSQWSAARYGNTSRCAGCPFVPDGSRRHRTCRGSGQNRRRCIRAGSHSGTVRFPSPATPYRSMRTGSCSSRWRGRRRNSVGKVWRIQVARPRTRRRSWCRCSWRETDSSTLRYRCSAAPDVSAKCRGTVSRACSIECLREWSTPCSRRTALDTWPCSSRGSWCAPSARSDSVRPSLLTRWHWWCLSCNRGWPRQPSAQTPSCFAPVVSWHRRHWSRIYSAGTGPRGDNPSCRQHDSARCSLVEPRTLH